MRHRGARRAATTSTMATKLRTRGAGLWAYRAVSITRFLRYLDPPDKSVRGAGRLVRTSASARYAPRFALAHSRTASGRFSALRQRRRLDTNTLSRRPSGPRCHVTRRPIVVARRGRGGGQGSPGRRPRITGAVPRGRKSTAAEPRGRLHVPHQRHPGIAGNATLQSARPSRGATSEPRIVPPRAIHGRARVVVLVVR